MALVINLNLFVAFIYFTGMIAYVNSCGKKAHGGWSPWSRFSSCDRSCGYGWKERTRRCDNPAPDNGGDYCRGSKNDLERCQVKPCSVHGSWSAWDTWSECSKTCGNGISSRTRQCNNPRPQHGGRGCVGKHTDIKNCMNEICPVHGSWSAWDTWSECSKTCGNGTSSRTRQCNNPRPQHGGRGCVGKHIDTKNCMNEMCPGLTQWGAWSRCSCRGLGERHRYRECSIGGGEEPCAGAEIHMVEGCETFCTRLRQMHLSSASVVSEDYFEQLQ